MLLHISIHFHTPFYREHIAQISRLYPHKLHRSGSPNHTGH